MHPVNKIITFSELGWSLLAPSVIVVNCDLMIQCLCLKQNWN